MPLIQKLLLVGQRIALTSSRMEEERIFQRAVPLLLPIEKFWDLDKMVQEADYLLANENSPADLKTLYKKIYQLAAPYAAKENDRRWLYKKSGLSIVD